MSPEQRDLDLFITYLYTNSLKQAAFEQGVRLQTAKNRLRRLYGRLGVHGALEASVALGWMRLPPCPPRRSRQCSLPEGHT